MRYGPAEQLLGLLLELGAAHAGLSVADIMERFGVSRRTAENGCSRRPGGSCPWRSSTRGRIAASLFSPRAAPDARTYVFHPY
jgi:hypothetical protein